MPCPGQSVNYDRLMELKNKYDPINLFRMNHNVRPVTQGAVGVA